MDATTTVGAIATTKAVPSHRANFSTARGADLRGLRNGKRAALRADASPAGSDM
ncbi:MAG TPA: hypothetical protein VFL10_11930 [Ornithinibacter sp.]|nr:hypothetical protein [Ornithinibacter sp.]